jgi:hypothetical protein
MVANFIIALQGSLCILHEVSSIEFLANYKCWKSASDQMTYDYSGSSGDVSLHFDYIVTDRGVATYAVFLC